MSLEGRMTGNPTDRFLHGSALRAGLVEGLAERSDAAAPATADDERAQAAVALTVVRGDDGCAELLVIMRAASLRRHASQFGLPGGRIEPGERIAATARRELAEELGVAVPAEDVLGGLPAVESISGFRIAPVVLWVEDPIEPVPDPVEVQDWYRLPLAQLARARVHPLGGGLPVLGTVIFAPTGAILQSFRDLLLPTGPPQEGELAEPPFTQR